MKYRLALLVAPAFAALAWFAPSPGSAANGIAFDAVSKLAMGNDASTIQPGTFDADFQKASSTKASTRGGMFAAMQRMGENASNMMQNGSAEHHYVAGSKERIDLVTPQTATIIDCSARTLTTLDLKNKTYHVSSLEAPTSGGSSSGSSDAGPNGKDDGSKVAIVVTNKSLGKKDVSGTNTDGFSSDMKITTTKPSGESSTSDMALTAYYSSFTSPLVRCPGSASAVATATRGVGMPAGGVGNFASILNTLRDAKGNPRFSVTLSGPALPLDNLALWQMATMAGGESGGPQGHSFAFLVERGNVHTITDADPAFTIPSDFKQQ